MKRAYILLGGLALIPLCLGWSAWAQKRLMVSQPLPNPAGSTTAPRKLALLIGVSHYKQGAKDAWKLMTCEPEILRLKDVLMKKFGFLEKDILILTKYQDTTQEAITLAFRKHLIEQAKPGDIVYWHYSGHGQQIPDDDNDELDGRDESIVPADAPSQKDSSKNIRDDEIGKWLDALKQKQPANITVSFDSCHSGSGTRAGGTSRGSGWIGEPVPSEKVRGTESSSIWWLDGEASTRTGFVFLAAAAPTQSAYSTTNSAFGDVGIFTLALIRAFERATPTRTYRELHQQIHDEVMTQAAMKRWEQSPQIEGDKNLRIFDGGALTSLPYTSLKVSQASVLLQAGKADGVTKGSKFAIYPDGTVDPKTSKKIADAEVIAVGIFESQLKLPTKIAPETLKFARAYETEHFYDETLLRVKMNYPASLPFSMELQAKVKNCELAQSVESRDNKWDVVIRQANAKDIKDQIVGATFRGIVIERKDGIIVGTIPEGQEMADKVKKALEAEVRFMTIQSLENTDPAINLHMRLVPVDAVDKLDGEIVTKTRDKPNALEKLPLEFSPGDYFMIEVKNSGTVPAYVMILNLTVDQTLEPAWPHPKLRDHSVSENIVNNDGKWHRISLPYVFRVTKPIRKGNSVESMKAIATQANTDFWPLLESLTQNDQAGEQRKAADNSPLGRILSAAQRGTRRNLNAAAPPAWATATASFIIKE